MIPERNEQVIIFYWNYLSFNIISSRLRDHFFKSASPIRCEINAIADDCNNLKIFATSRVIAITCEILAMSYIIAITWEIVAINPMSDAGVRGRSPRPKRWTLSGSRQRKSGQRASRGWMHHPPSEMVNAKLCSTELFSTELFDRTFFDRTFFDRFFSTD